MHEQGFWIQEQGLTAYIHDVHGVKKRRRQSCLCSLHTTVQCMSTVRSQLNQEQELTS